MEAEYSKDMYTIATRPAKETREMIVDFVKSGWQLWKLE